MKRSEFDARVRAKWLTQKANIPPRMLKRTLADLELEPKVRTTINGWLEEIRSGESEGIGLLFHGSPGTGKTTLAAAVLREVIETAPLEWLGRCPASWPSRPGYFLMHTRFIQLHHDSFDNSDRAEDAKNMLDALYCRWDNGWQWRNVKCLVLDDAGKENPTVGTGHKSQVMHDVIRERYNAMAPTILTTNYRPQDWTPNYGEATSSFMKEGFVPVKVDGKVWR